MQEKNKQKFKGKKNHPNQFTKLYTHKHTHICLHIHTHIL